MSQSGFIFGATFIAFVIYITLRGELPNYIGIFSGKPLPGGSGSGSGGLFSGLSGSANAFVGSPSLPSNAGGSLLGNLVAPPGGWTSQDLAILNSTDTGNVNQGQQFMTWYNNYLSRIGSH